MPRRKPWYQSLFERDYYDYFYTGGPRGTFPPEEEARRTDAQVDFIVQALECPENARILDLCCGHGRHAIRLTQRGYRVTGLDLSRYHLRLAKASARKAGVEVEWLRADMRDVPRGPFDAAINMFTAFGYFDEEADDQRVLDGVSRSLRKGGKLMIDLINQARLMRAFRETDWQRRHEGAVTLERRRYDILRGCIENEWTYIAPDGKQRRHSFSHRLYTYTELAAMLERAGMRPLRAWGNFDGTELSMRSARMIVLAEKQ